MGKSTEKLASKNQRARVVTTDAEIDAALARAEAYDATRPHVISAQYRPRGDTVVLTLATGVVVAIPRRLLQGLEGATKAQLAQIIIEGPGTGLHWPALDVDHYVPALLAGLFGNRQWMAEIGKKGGRVTSPTKAEASRRNGKRGGRPRKVVVQQVA